MNLTVMNSFFLAWSPPNILRELIDPASAVCILGCVIGGGLVAYGSKLGTDFKITPTQEEAIGVYKFAVRLSIRSGFIGAMIGLIGYA